MPRHRALRTTVQRGIAHWPIVAAVLVVVSLLGWLGWSWAGDIAQQRSAAIAASCPRGDTTLRIAAAPNTADAVRDIAQTWSAQRPVVYEHCVKVEVRSVNPDSVADGLLRGWNDQILGGQPHAWIADSTLWVNRVRAIVPGVVNTAPVSIATSPLALAAITDQLPTLANGQRFSWRALGEFATADSRRKAIALPHPTASSASSLAVQGAFLAPDGHIATNQFATETGRNLLNRLAERAGRDSPTTTRQALADLSSGDPSFATVPALEVDIFQHNKNQSSSARPLYSHIPDGPTLIADFPFTALSPAEITETQARATQAFRGFLLEEQQQKTLTNYGLRTSEAMRMPTAAGLTWPALSNIVPQAEAATAAQIASAWTSALSQQAITVLVSTAESMNSDGGDNRSTLDWVQHAIRDYVNHCIAGEFGLWEFSENIDNSKPYREIAPLASISTNRDKAISSISELRTHSARHLYPSLTEVYGSVADKSYRAGKINQILVITDGSDTSGISAQQTLTDLKSAIKPNQPVTINIVALGAGPDHAALTQFATATNGTALRIADGRGMRAAINELLSH